MTLEIDHLVVAARTLEEGARWIAERLGVAPVPGGRHPLMGTHNCLLGLGREAYLEVIAIDPLAPPPGRPRWFALDSPGMQLRLAKGPALIHWVVRTEDIEAAARSASIDPGEIVSLSRGDFRWRILVAADGSLPAEGAFPTLIQWEGDRRPAASLPESECRLESIELRHAKSAELLATLRELGLSPGDIVATASGSPGLSAVLSTPRGTATLA